MNSGNRKLLCESRRLGQTQLQMDKSETTDQKRWIWIHRTLVTLVVVVFIPVIYLGTAPFVLNALYPAYDAADEDGLFVKSADIFVRPSKKSVIGALGIENGAGKLWNKNERSQSLF